MNVPTNEQLAAANIHVFNEIYKIKNDQGDLLDFKQHPFLWDIFEDLTPIQAIRKAAQVGFSTTANIKAMWLAKNRKMDIIYSLPTESDVRKFVGTKTNRLIANNPIFQTWTEDKDSIEQKLIGKNSLHFIGTWTERAALMIPADLYVSDETDRSKQDVVKQFETRLQHSQYKWRWYFSNPSAPGVGVDKYWEQSDQKHWFIKCEHCGHDWYMTMENIKPYKDLLEPEFLCTKCGQPVDRRKGRWVKRWQNKEVSGYWISLLMCPWVSAKDILRRKQDTPEDQFTNFVLGQPYIGKGNVLTENLLFQNLSQKVNPQDARPIIGVDTGIDIRYVIGNKYGLYYYNECKDYSELEKLMQRYKDAIMVIDQGGDIIGPRKLREKYPGRVFLCFFRQDRKNDSPLNWHDEDNTVIADRNKIIQLVVDEFTERRIPISGKQSEWWNYWLHWSHMYRVADYNEDTGITVYKWLRSDRDDWALATIYWRIGIDRFLENYVSFNDGSVPQFASTGIEASPEGETVFLPKVRHVLPPVI